MQIEAGSAVDNSRITPDAQTRRDERQAEATCAFGSVISAMVSVVSGRNKCILLETFVQAGNNGGC
jgi:hypothetical protein